MMGRQFAAAIFLVAIPALALAAPPKPAAAPAGAHPQFTTKNFGDWTLRCKQIDTGAAARKACEIAQAIRSVKTKRPVAEVAIGRFNKTDPFRLTAHVPSNIALPSQVKFDYREAHGIDLRWRRCLPIGCYADAPLTDAELKIFHVQTEPGAIEYFTASGRPVKLPISFRGLNDALNALAKE